MKLFNVNVPTLFPSPINATEARFYAMNHVILCLGAILCIFLVEDSGSIRHQVLNLSGEDISTSLMIRFIHLGCSVLLITLGPNVSPIGIFARLCSVYGVGNTVSPCSGSPKFFSQIIGTSCTPLFLDILVFTSRVKTIVV